jgi:hypothetical protein
MYHIWISLDQSTLTWSGSDEVITLGEAGLRSSSSSASVLFVRVVVATLMAFWRFMPSSASVIRLLAGGMEVSSDFRADSVELQTVCANRR